MVLSSSVYFIFLVGIFFLYWPLSRYRVAGLAVILFANYFFYAKWDLFYLALIPAASMLDYLVGRWLGTAERLWLRRLLVTLSVLANLGILASFKYMPFLLGNYAAVTGQPVPAAAIADSRHSVPVRGCVSGRVMHPPRASVAAAAAMAVRIVMSGDSGKKPVPRPCNGRS